MKGWNEQRVKQLKDEGKIIDFKIIGCKNAEKYSADVPKNMLKKRSKEKAKIASDLTLYCRENHLLLIPEFDFHPYRKWRFDWAVFRGVTLEQVKKQRLWQPANQIAAIEYEGIFSEKSGHTTIAGYTKDVEKYNQANALGWKLIRLTAKDYKTVLQQLKYFI